MIVLAQLALELLQLIVFLVHLLISKQAHLHVFQLARMASTPTPPHTYVLHANQLVPPAMEAQAQIAYLALFHCITKLQLYSV